MQEPKILLLSELLQSSRPLTGAFSLNPSYSSPEHLISDSIPHSKSRKSPKQSGNDENGFNRSSYLESLEYPSIIIGTLNLPTANNNCKYNKKSCFSFSDGSSSRVCCDFLGIDIIKTIGKQIHVLAWNFIPFHCKKGGFLEIIRWRSCSPHDGCVTDQCSSTSLDSAFMLASSSYCQQENFKTRSFVHGIIASVSPVFCVPCTVSDKSSTESGFLAELMVCKCQLCTSKISVQDLLHRRSSSHSFMVPVTVYFLGSAASCHPIVTKLLGNVVCFTGLKKKMVFIGKQDSCCMLITTDKAALRYRIGFSDEATMIKRSGDSGAYSGTVTGVYMEGMVVELDEKVWILVTDRLLAPPHSLRIGAMVSVINVHFVCPRFSWTRMLLLGTCYKTSIKVKSFSLMETPCHTQSQMQSLLDKFTESLVFSARFWLLLRISSFRKNISTFVSEKEILGSKNKIGMVQMYATSILPLYAFKPRSGVFTEFCKHNLCGCVNEQYCSSLKLAVPITNFVGHCERLWVNMLLDIQNGSEVVEKKICLSLFSCEGKSYCRMLRRIMSSEGTGIVLIGSLQISPFSGRLQLIDATGSIDVVIPDFPSNCDVRSIYEVRTYSIVLEGLPAEVGDLGFSKSKPFSWRDIFHHVQVEREIKPAAFYLHFSMTDTTCLNETLNHPSKTGGFDNHMEIQNGFFHLVLVTHKFPAVRDFLGEPIISKKSSLFAEAIVLPWNLLLEEDQVTDSHVDAPEERSRRDYSGNLPNKRPKHDHISSLASTSTSNENIRILSSKSFGCPIGGKFSHRGFSDTIDTKTLVQLMKYNLRSYKSNRQNVLLEFKSETLRMYELLQVGVCYLIRSPVQDPGNCTEVILHMSADAFGRLKVDIEGSKDKSIMSIALFVDTANISFCLKTMASELQCFRQTVLDGRLPQGALISVHGYVVDVHSLESDDVHNEHLRCGDSGNICQLRSFRGSSGSTCIHISDGCQLVKLRGVLSQHAYPIGMGPGIRATFHRVLVGQQALMLTPVTFIVINSVKEVCDKVGLRCSGPMFGLDVLQNALRDTVTGSLISELILCQDSKPKKFRCRVVAIHLLWLEKQNCELSNVQMKEKRKSSPVNIPLAGFIVDDGSSLCCCWASAERAAVLLRLDEEISNKAFISACRMKAVRSIKAQSTARYHLQNVLNKHHKVTLSCSDNFLDSCENLRLTVNSVYRLSCSDENLLKRIILDAKCGPVVNIVGSKMDSNAVAHLKELTGIRMPKHVMKNIWVLGVQNVDPRTEANTVFRELL
ncbi:CST complex subunit CTC1-like [Papaver somniferum]|uniref:CST complex subunit CTC1-like n=1 Tax=Papaver somniferum TaxID=3469 RepID=UPI000E702538|nr:CST complex subunit CTC1-like [Papaver somniferum]